MSKNSSLGLAVAIPALVLASVIYLFGQSHSWLVVNRAEAQADQSLNQDAAVAGVTTTKLSSIQPEIFTGLLGVKVATGSLDQLGVTVYPEDVVTAFPDPQLGVGGTIRLYRAQAVLVNDGGTEQLIRTWANNVREALAEHKIEVGEKDRLEPAADQPVLTDQRLIPVKVVITRVEETEIKLKEEILFETTVRYDDQVERGIVKVQRSGQTGVLVKTYFIRRENGEEVERKLVDSQVEREAVAKIVIKGTKTEVYGTGTATWYTKRLNHVAAHNTLPRGTRVKVINIANGRSTIVTVVGGGLGGAIIDLSYDAFSELGDPGAGRLQVRLEKVYE